MALAIAEIQKLLAMERQGYRFSRANLRRNSYVPLDAVTDLAVSARSLYSRFDERITTSPRYVLCDDNLTLVAGSSELLVFDRYGEVQTMQDMHPMGLAYLGQEGYAWVTTSGQLSATDINRDVRINRHSLPLVSDNSAVVLWFPFEEGFIAAVQDFGQPFSSTELPEFYLYAMTYEKPRWNWLVKLPGVVQDVFVSGDQSKAIVRQDSTIRVYDTGNGELVNESDMALDQIRALILGTGDELIMLARETDGEVSTPVLGVYTPDCTKLWDLELSEEVQSGFLAAGEDGFVVVSSKSGLRGFTAGKEQYHVEFEDSVDSRLTVFRENQVLAVTGKTLQVVRADGSNRVVCDLSDYDDQLLTSPAVTSDGRVAIGTDRALMAFA